MVESAKGQGADPTLVLAGIAILLLGFGQTVDSYLANLIYLLLSPTAIPASNQTSTAPILGSAASAQSSDQMILALLNGALCLIYAAGGYICFRYLRSNRIIVVPQLLVLTAVLVYPFSRLSAGLHPISYIALALIGASLGLIGYRLIESNERTHTQQIESTLRSRQLMETRLQLIKQDEVERKMLAADLHDQVLNDLKLLLRTLEQNKDTVGEKLLADLNSRITFAMESIRKVMESLCPSDLEHIGLLASLEECLIERADKNDFIPQYRSSLSEDDINVLNKIEKALLYRLVQESITNICKHAKASKVRLTAELIDGELVIRIVDDGVGLKATEANSKSRGLQYMRLRGEIIGARINWSPGPENKGTAVEIRINLARTSNQISSAESAGTEATAAALPDRAPDTIPETLPDTIPDTIPDALPDKEVRQ